MNIVIIGGTRGIGRETAIALAQNTEKQDHCNRKESDFPAETVTRI